MVGFFKHNTMECVLISCVNLTYSTDQGSDRVIRASLREMKRFFKTGRQSIKELCKWVTNKFKKMLSKMGKEHGIWMVYATYA